MKRIKALVLVVGLYSLLFIFSSAVYKSAGSHPGSTGAPEELTCARSTCHDDNNSSPGDGVNTLKFGTGGNRYKKGTTYDLTLKIAKAGLVRSGFEIVALDSFNKMIGTWKIFNATKTQITKVDSLARFYVTHKVASTPSSGNNFNEWAFGWTAPAAYEGKVTFYYATNACNSDGKRFGDKSYLSSYSVYGESMIVASIAEALKFSLIPFPNPTNGLFQVEINTTFNSQSKLEIFTPNGKLIRTIKLDENSANQNLSVDLSDCVSGYYLIKYSDNQQYAVTKVFKQ
jgi:hypothetical protein